MHQTTMNQSIDISLVNPETGKEEDQIMSAESDSGASLMQSAVLADPGLIYMLQQQQGTGEGTVMLSSGSLPLLMSSCQVMALHPSISQQFVSGSSTVSSPSSLVRSSVLSHDGSVIWHSTVGAEDQLVDNFDEEQQLGNSGPNQLQVSVSGILLTSQLSSHQQITVNGSTYLTSCASQSAGFVSSMLPKVIVTVPPKTSLAAPKKPLTPYMKFSKTIWQHVKSANPSLSVCEVGASIGRLWREMTEPEKQKYNDEFQREKAVYETELQNYLQATGLQISDLSRTKKKDPRDRSKSSCSQVATTNQNFPKNIHSQALPHVNVATMAAGQNLDSEGARLPHISQMWSDHSIAHQLQVSSRNQTVLKTVCSSFDSGRFKAIEPCFRLHENLNSELSQGLVNLAVEMPSGVPWTWVKTIDQTNLSRSVSVDTLDTSQSAYLKQSQVGLKVTMMFDPPNGREFSSPDELEPGEVVVESIEQSSQMNTTTSQNSSATSAHNIYNSYAVNPWNHYKLTSERLNDGEAIFDKEQILKTELIHLRGSLSEKTKEVEQLMKELEMAYKLINKLQNSDASQIQHPLIQLAASGNRDIGKDINCQHYLSEKDQKIVNRETVTECIGELAVKGRGSCVSEKPELKDVFLSKTEVNKTDSNWCDVVTSHLYAMVNDNDVTKINMSTMESKAEKSSDVVIVGHEVLDTFDNRVKLSNRMFSKTSGQEVYHSLQVAHGLHGQVELDNKEITNELLALITKQHNCIDSELKIIAVKQQDVVDQQLNSLIQLRCNESQANKSMLNHESENRWEVRSSEQMKFQMNANTLANLDMKSEDSEPLLRQNENVLSSAESKEIKL